MKLAVVRTERMKQYTAGIFKVTNFENLYLDDQDLMSDDIAPLPPRSIQEDQLTTTGRIATKDPKHSRKQTTNNNLEPSDRQGGRILYDCGFKAWAVCE